MDDTAAIAEQYFTYESRLESFKTTHKKRASSSSTRGGAGGKMQSLTWPHKDISIVELAKAGFFFLPLATHPDQVVCFLCHKGLDGWEEGDDPLREHVTHSPGCGWAIVAAVTAEADGYADADPMSLEMIDARRMTFAGRWPHDSKKAWKCKTKQLAEAGWNYTPTPESDDMATCVYCHLALDGWEPADKPLNEHYSRSPNCPFFTLSAQNQTQTQTKKSTTGRGKGARVSKASSTARLSVQSITSVGSESHSMSDLLPASVEDSILATGSGTGRKGVGRTKRAAPKRGAAKTRPKKEEDEDEEVAARAGRGKKRGSDAVEDPALAELEAPAAKKRAVKTGGGGEGVVGGSDLERAVRGSVDSKRATAAAATKSRRAAASARSNGGSNDSNVSSIAPNLGLPGAFPMDEDELVQQLEQDLDRDLTEDEAAGGLEKSNFDMFDTTPAGFDEEALDQELRALHDMRMEELEIERQRRQQQQQRPRPRQMNEAQGRARPVGDEVQDMEPQGQQGHEDDTTARTLEAPTYTPNSSIVSERPAEDPADLESAAPVEKESMLHISEEEPSGLGRIEGQAQRGPMAEDSDSGHNLTVVSVVSVVSSTETAAGMAANPERRKRGRPSKKGQSDTTGLAVKEEQQTAPVAAAPKRGRPSKKSKSDTSRLGAEPEQNSGSALALAPAPPKRGRPSKKSKPDSSQLVVEEEQRAQAPAPNSVPASAPASKRGRPVKHSESDSSQIAAEEERRTPTRGRGSKRGSSGSSRLVAETEQNAQAPTPAPTSSPPAPSIASPEPKAGLKSESELMEAGVAEEAGEERSPVQPSSPRPRTAEERAVAAAAGTATPTATLTTPPPLPRSPTRQTPAISSSMPPSSAPRHVPSTPVTSHVSPAIPARQPIRSRSHSPQSSDAENRAPATRPQTTLKRVALAPLPLAVSAAAATTTPSPSKRAVIPAGRIQTEGTPWREVDLDAVFAAFEEVADRQRPGQGGGGSESGEEDGGGAALLNGQELSSEEREMTVEQWIYHNAGAAEARMRQECESMVSRFESDGGRAMRVLEGLVVDY